MTDRPLCTVARLPTRPGVYRFRDARARVLYVGRAKNLRLRVASYWGPLADRGHLRRMVGRIARVDALACDSEHEAAWLERNVLERSLPYWNRTAGGQEVPVFIRLDRSPDDVAWVRAALEERRDNAASTLDFEFAGKLQADLRAVEWAVCEQKATGTAAVDLDVHGWADGTLLRLEIRSGRLRGWSHRACSAERAAAKITSRPPDWAAFADRNAGLAASLELASGDPPGDGRSAGRPGGTVRLEQDHA